MKQLIIGLTLALGLSQAANSQSLVINAVNGTTYSTDAMTGFATDNTLMDGISITAFFAGGTSQTVSFDGPSGIAAGTGWSLSELGDTFSSDWILTNTAADAIINLVIDGKPGKTTFDRTNPDPGTPGSASGRDFVVTSTNNWDITVTYRDILALTGNPPVGDEYTTLEIAFGGDGFGTDSRLTFGQDTDNATTVIIRVPEPASFLLFTIGIAAMQIRRLRFN